MDLPYLGTFWRRVASAFAGPVDASGQTGDGSVYQFVDAPPKSLALVLLLDKDAAGIETFLATSQRQLARFERVVYLVSTTDLRPFTRRGALVEVFPDRAALALSTPAQSTRTYLRSRYEFLLQKWRPDWVLSYGTDIDNYLSTPHDE